MAEATVHAWWSEVRAALEGRVPDPEADAHAIAAAARSATEANAMAARRAGGAPLGLVLGRQRFCGLELFTAEGVLAPRPETELLARTAIDELRRLVAAGIAPQVVDVCCGSGNLAVATAHAVPEARVYACDLTDACVALTRRNVEALGLSARVSVHQGDLFAPLAMLGLAQRVHLVVCNPPYISTTRLSSDRAALLTHEPREAFDAGPYGLAIHQRVVREVGELLAPGGALMFEIGQGQEKQVRILFQRTRAFAEPLAVHDAAGETRVLWARAQPR